MQIFRSRYPVRRPISLKIFSIAVVLLVLMVAVTTISTLHLRKVGRELDLLVRFYIPIDQQVERVRHYSLLEILFFERLARPGAQMQPAAPAAASRIYQQVGNCERGAGAAMDTIKSAADAAGQYWLQYQFMQLCADEAMRAADSLVRDASARDDVKNDPDQNAKFTELRAQLKDIPVAREQLHATIAKFVAELSKGDERVVELLHEELDHDRAEVGKQIRDVTDIVHTNTRETAARVEQLEQRALWLSWAVTGAAAVLGLFFAALFTRSLVRPIGELLTGTQAIEKGELDIQLRVGSADEIALLADSFNHMASGLKQKEIIKETFGKYIDPRIVKGLLEEKKFAGGGEKRVMTVFFSDLEGFTSVCERLTPDGVVKLLNQYLTLMSASIRHSHGIIDKYIGDAIMAFWGPPFTGEGEHAGLACAAALEQLSQLIKFRAMLPDILHLRKELPAINVRMGISTGDVTVGSVGSEWAKSYTVIGDNVNLASRLESANKQYGTHVLVAEETWTMAQDGYEAREIDTINVVGKTEPVRIFELLGRKGEISQTATDLRAQYALALALCRGREWDAARAGFEACLKIDPNDKPSRLFAERAARLKEHPPADNWDGVWTLTEK